MKVQVLFKFLKTQIQCFILILKLQNYNDLDMLGIRGEALVTCFLYNSVEILDPYGT